MAYSKFYVTFSEMALLQILWDASRPLNRQEIMAKAYENPEEPLFARTSFHLLANELHKKGLLVPVDNMGIGRRTPGATPPPSPATSSWPCRCPLPRTTPPRTCPRSSPP